MTVYSHGSRRREFCKHYLKNIKLSQSAKGKMYLNQCLKAALHEGSP